MSVYKPAKSRFWQYDFQHKGRRFHGSTGVEGKRDAEAVERRIRIQAAKGELDDASRMTSMWPCRNGGMRRGRPSRAGSDLKRGWLA